MPHRVLLLWKGVYAGTAVGAGAGLGTLAMTADGWSAAITAIAMGITTIGVAFSVAIVKMSPAIAQAIREIGPAILEFLAGVKKLKAMHIENREQIEANADKIAGVEARADAAERKAEEVATDAAHAKEEAAHAKADLAAMRAENTALRDHLVGLLTNVPDLGEAVLIQAGDMKDPVKATNPSEGQP